MNVLPSTSVSRAPAARLMNSGEPPTDLKARTGLSTPPGRMALARAKSFWEVTGFFMVKRMQNAPCRIQFRTQLEQLNSSEFCILNSDFREREPPRARNR